MYNMWVPVYRCLRDNECINPWLAVWLLWNRQLESHKQIPYLFYTFSVLSPVFCCCLMVFYNLVLGSNSCLQYAGLHVSPLIASDQTLCQALLQTTCPLSNKSFQHDDKPFLSLWLLSSSLCWSLFAFSYVYMFSYTCTQMLTQLSTPFWVLSFIVACLYINTFVFFEALCDLKYFINKSDWIWLANYIIWWER